MAKVLIIETCSECPFFQDAYVEWGMTREYCKKEKRNVRWRNDGGRGSYPIPEFCTLPNKEKDEHKDL